MADAVMARWSRSAVADVGSASSSEARVCRSSSGSTVGAEGTLNARARWLKAN
jgi:hypothetical protein